MYSYAAPGLNVLKDNEAVDSATAMPKLTAHRPWWADDALYDSVVVVDPGAKRVANFIRCSPSELFDASFLGAPT